MKHRGAASLVLVSALLSIPSSILASPRSSTCKRERGPRRASATDHVCVARRQAQSENSATSSRHTPGSVTCILGYVWREPHPNDHGCLYTTTYAQAQVQTSQAPGLPHKRLLTDTSILKSLESSLASPGSKPDPTKPIYERKPTASPVPELDQPKPVPDSTSIRAQIRGDGYLFVNAVMLFMLAGYGLWTVIRRRLSSDRPVPPKPPGDVPPPSNP
jgi:hypothetical protein